MRFLWIGIALAVVLTLYSLIDAIRTDKYRVQSLPKPAWIVLIIIVPLFGPVLWILYGKTGFRNSVKQTAPDDDVDFLNSLDKEIEFQERIQFLEDQLKQLNDEDDQPDKEDPKK